MARPVLSNQGQNRKDKVLNRAFLCIRFSRMPTLQTDLCSRVATDSKTPLLPLLHFL